MKLLLTFLKQRDELDTIKRSRLQELEATESVKLKKHKLSEEVTQLSQIKEAAMLEMKALQEKIDKLKGQLQQFQATPQQQQQQQQQQLQHQYQLALHKQQLGQQQQQQQQQSAQQQKQSEMELQARFTHPAVSSAENKQYGAEHYRGYPPNSLRSMISSTSPVENDKARALALAQKQHNTPTQAVQPLQQAVSQRTSPAFAYGASKLASPSRSNSSGSSSALPLPPANVKSNYSQESLQHAVTAFHHHQHQLQQQQQQLQLQQQQIHQQQQQQAKEANIKFTAPNVPTSTTAAHSQQAINEARWYGTGQTSEQEYRMFQHQQQQQHMLQLRQQQQRAAQPVPNRPSSASGRDQFPTAMPVAEGNVRAPSTVASPRSDKYTPTSWRQQDPAQLQQQQQLAQQHQLAKMAQMAAAANLIASSEKQAAQQAAAQQAASRTSSAGSSQNNTETERPRPFVNNSHVVAELQQQQQQKQQQQQQSPFGSDVRCKACQKEANFMCSACRGAHYCSLECQVIHTTFRLTNPPSIMCCFQQIINPAVCKMINHLFLGTHELSFQTPFSVKTE